MYISILAYVQVARECKAGTRKVVLIQGICQRGGARLHVSLFLGSAGFISNGWVI